MRALRWLLWAVLALLLVSSLAVSALWLRPELAQPWLEAWLSHKLQREFRVLGEFEATLGRVVEVSATEVQLANPAWASEPQLLKVTRLELAFSLDSIWADTFLFQRLLVEQAQLSIETGPDGEPSWKMQWGDPGSSEKPEESRSPEPALWFHQFEIRGLDIRIAAQEPADSRHIHIDRLLQTRRGDDMLELELGGSWQGRPIRYTGELGPLTGLLQGTDIRALGQGSFGLLEVKGQLELDSLKTPRHPSLDLELSGSDIAEVADMLGLPAPGSGAFQITARSGLEAGRLRSRVQAHVGGLELELNGQSRELLDLSSLDYEIKAHGPNLGAVVAWFGVDGWPTEAFRLSGGLGRDGRHLDLRKLQLDVADTHFILDGSLGNFPKLGDSRIELLISGPEVERFRALLGIKGVATGPFTLNVHAQANSQGQDLLDAEFESSALRGKLKGQVSAGNGYVGSDLQLEVQGQDAGSILAGLGLSGFPRQALSLTTRFSVQDAGFELAQGSLLTIGSHRLAVSGLIGRQPLVSDTNLQFQVSGPDLHQIAHMRKLELALDLLPYQLSGGLRIADGRVRLDKLGGTVGPTRLQLDGLLPLSGGLNGADFAFQVEGPDLQRFMQENWDLKAPLARPFSASGRFAANATQLELRAIRLQSGRLEGGADLVLSLPLSKSSGRFDIEARGPDLQAVLEQLGGFKPANAPFELTAKGSLEEGAVSFEHASLGLGDASLRLDGKLDLWPDMSATSLRIRLDAPDIEQLGRVGDTPWPRLPLKLASDLSGTVNSLRFSKLDLTLGSSDLSGQLELSLGADVPGINGTLQSKLLNFEELGSSLPERPERPAPKDERVIPDWPLPLAQLAALNAGLNYTADRLQLTGRSFSGVELVFGLQDGALQLSRIVGRGLEGHAQGSASITPLGDGTAAVRSEMNVTGLVLNLSKTEGVDPASLPKLSMAFDLSGSGRGLRELAASLNGGLHLRSESGVIPNSVLGILDAGFLEQLVKSIVPKSQRPTTTRLQCFETRVAAQQGQLAVVPGLALVTDNVEIYSRGQVDLDTERMVLGLETRPTKALRTNFGELLINPFVRITGTMAKPQLSLDASRALVFSGTAVATAGLSIVAKGLFDRMKQSGKGDACQRLLEAGSNK